MKKIKSAMFYMGISLFVVVIGQSSLYAQASYHEEFESKESGGKEVISKNGCVVKDGVLIDYIGTDTELIVPEGVKHIARAAGNKDSKWKEVTSLVVPESVESIADEAFYGSKLERVAIPASTELGSMAFAKCEGLADENGLIIVNDTLFEIVRKKMNADKIVVVPEGVKRIDTQTAYDDGVFVIKKLVLPGSLRKIEKGAFNGCSIAELEFKKGITKIVEASFVLSRIGRVDLPESLTYIEKKAFQGSMREVKVPDSVGYIGADAFPAGSYRQGTEQEEEYVFQPLVVIGYKNSTAELYVKKMGNIEFTSIGESRTQNGSKYRQIGEYHALDHKLIAFTGDESSIIVPDDITVIGESVFTDCFKLKYAYIPAAVSEIGTDAFGTKVIIFGSRASTAQLYAREHKNIFYEVKDKASFLQALDIIHAGENQPESDVNGDNQVDLTDAQLVLKKALKITSGEGLNLLKMDANKDGTVDLNDAQLVLKRALKI